MKRIANTLLPAKHSVLLRLFLWKRIIGGQRQKISAFFKALIEGNWKLYFLVVDFLLFVVGILAPEKF